MALRSRSRFSQNEIDIFDLVDGANAWRRQAEGNYGDWSVSGSLTVCVLT
jgi:hypothetical protein